jgi:peptidoglycan/xylan/chitin deacetylase (PgdA/CDA1 family)
MIDPISRYLLDRSGGHGPVMLMYHSVVPGRGTPDWPWAVSHRDFCAQLDFLAAEGYAAPTMAELASSPGQWKGRTAAITFDDGYVDNLVACDELQKRGMRATWFVVSGSIGQEPAWPADGRPAGRLLSADELRDMQRAGMEIGSHSVNHIRLTEADDARLMTELSASRADLGNILGCEVQSFAYPYGARDERCEGAVREAGYAYACTTRTGWALRDKNPYRLRRLSVLNTDSLGCFARKLSFASHNVAWPDMVRYLKQRLLVRTGLRK